MMATFHFLVPTSRNVTSTRSAVSFSWCSLLCYRIVTYYLILSRMSLSKQSSRPTVSTERGLGVGSRIHSVKHELIYAVVSAVKNGHSDTYFIFGVWIYSNSVNANYQQGGIYILVSSLAVPLWWLIHPSDNLTLHWKAKVESRNITGLPAHIQRKVCFQEVFQDSGLDHFLRTSTT